MSDQVSPQNLAAKNLVTQNPAAKILRGQNPVGQNPACTKSRGAKILHAPKSCHR